MSKRRGRSAKTAWYDKPVVGMKVKFWLVLGVVLTGFAWQAGYLVGTPLGNTLDDLWAMMNTPRDTTTIVPGTDMITPVIGSKEKSDPAHTASDVAINMYADNGGTVGSYIATATASSGIATFTGYDRREGTYVWVQARQAAPGSETHFITPAYKCQVPNGDSGDDLPLIVIDNDNLGFLWVDECADTAPTLLAMNSTYYAVNITTNFEVMTSETILNFRLTYSSSDSDEVHGYPYDFTDYVTGKHYLGGMWLVLKCNNSAPFDGYTYTFADQTYTYYIFKMGQTMQDISGTSIGDLTVINYAVELVSGGDWGNDIQIVADTYQCLMEINGQISSSACFVATHAIDVTAETFDVNN